MSINSNRKKTKLENTAAVSFQLCHLLSSEWFLPLLFGYLQVNEIVKLDSVTRKWKLCYGNDFSSLSTRVQTFFINHKAIEWSIKKGIRFAVLHLTYTCGQQLINHRRKNVTINKEGTILLSQLCANLIELRMIFRAPFSIHSEWFNQLPIIGQNLQILDIQGELPISDNDLVIIGNTCKNLKEIVFHIYNTYITQIGIIGLVKNASNLISFTSSGHDTAPLTLILSQYCPLIEHLDIFYETEDDFEIFTKTCTNLKSLSVWSYCSNCTEDSDNFLHYIGENNKLIESFHVEMDGADFSFEGLKYLACTCLKLKSVEIMCLEIISEVTVRHFVNNCPLLENFCFDSWKMTDDVLKELGQCLTLQKIDLYRSDVTDTGIQYLLEKNHNFKEIDISNCEFLTANSLFTIGNKCPQLMHFDCQLGTNMNFNIEGFNFILSNCHQLTEKSVATVRELITGL